MKYNRLPSKMWLVFNHSFRKELTNTFGYSKRDAIIIAKKAKADVVPIGIKGFDGYAGKSLFKKHITITIGKPISYELPPEEILKQWAEQICEYTGYENRIGQEQEVSQ